MRHSVKLVLVVLAVAVLIAGCGPKPNVLGKAGKYQVTVEDLDKLIGPRAFRSYEDELNVKKQAVQRALEEKLILTAAYNERYDTLPEIKQFVESNKKSRLLQALYDIEIVKNAKDIPESEVKSAYEMMKEEINAAHILVDSKELADSIYKMLKNGASFEELAAKYSLDRGTKDRGGDLGWFTAFTMDPDFEKAAFALNPGQFSEPVKTRFGWHIIMVKGKRKNPNLKTFEEEKERITDLLRRKKQRELVDKFLENLKNEANIQFNPDAVKIVLRELSTLPPPEKYMQPNAPQPKGPQYTDEEKSMKLCTWKGGSWTIAQFDSAFNTIPPFRRGKYTNEEQLKDLIFAMLQPTLLEQKALEMGVDKSEEYNDYLKRDLERRMIDIYKRKIMDVNITDEMVRKYYEENKDSFMTPATIKAIEIQVATEDEAKKLIDRIKKGEDAKELAKKYTLRTYVKDRGGELELTERRYPELYRAAQQINPGDVYPVPIPFQGKYSVIKVIEKIPPQPRPFERVARIVRSRLRVKLRNKAYKDWIEKAKKKYGFKIYEKNIAKTIDKSKYEGKEEEKPKTPAS